MILILLSATVNLSAQVDRTIEINPPNTRQVTDDFQIQFLHELLVADARAFQDLRCAQRSATQDDVLPRFDDSLKGLCAIGTIPSGNVCHSDSFIPFENNTRYTCIGAKVKIRLDVHNAVNVSCSGVAAATSVAIDVLGPDLGGMRGVQVCGNYESKNTRW